jgi:hypothetical protein
VTHVTYTYRLVIAGGDSVQVQVRGPQGQDLGQPRGKLGYTTARRARIGALSQQALLGKDKRALAEDEIRELGETLFAVLFDETLQVSFFSWYQQAVVDEDAILRLELDIDEQKMPELAALPWEMLCVPANNQFTGDLWLATAPNLVFSRFRTRWHPAAPIQLEAGEKLSIAVAVADPSDSDLGPVAYEKLWTEIQRLAAENADQFASPILINPATRAGIDDALEAKPHLFHFIGHGRLTPSPTGDVGEIAILEESGYARWVNAAKFGGLFNRHKPGVVFLQACEGGASSASKAFVGVASQIVQQNVPVVVAMQYEISNASARRFAREFYTRLACDEPVDKAAQEGRNEIEDWHETLDFATPVLFMRVAQGQIFSRPGKEEDQEREELPSLQDDERPLMVRLRDALLECGPFEDDKGVAALFADRRLRPWRYSVPQGWNPMSRVSMVIDHLHNKYRADTKENALVLLLQILAETQPGTRCAQRLASLAGEYAAQDEAPSF